MHTYILCEMVMGCTINALYYYYYVVVRGGVWGILWVVRKGERVYKLAFCYFKMVGYLGGRIMYVCIFGNVICFMGKYEKKKKKKKLQNIDVFLPKKYGFLILKDD
eukprot:TRINITY_DN13911_c0_g2_i2.p3 TRINITY_DN13911_c0_g2~~TRINITY_DN13911_c0_g2_i2.p3  ORF type:complete len:106 (+),score=10.06 TRINITY_DN13911_c0_g2_i2:365-682(+)